MQINLHVIAIRKIDMVCMICTCYAFAKPAVVFYNAKFMDWPLLHFIDIYLTNRFHFAVRLYSDNAQMTSKRGENKEVRYEPKASSVTDVLTTF